MISYKRILYLLGGLTGTLVALILIITLFFQNRVKEIVVQAINQQLIAKVHVEDIGFSLFRNFPYASVTFKNVVIEEPENFQTTGELVRARQISLLISPASLFSSTYRLKKVVMEDASLNLQSDGEGKNNYDIWKSVPGKTKSDQLSLALQEVVLKNVDVLYYHSQKKYDLVFLVRDGVLSGDFQKDLYSLTAKADLEETYVELDEVRYLRNANCRLELSLDVDRAKDSYNFINSFIQVEGLKLTMDGTIIQSATHTDLDLDITAPGADLPALLSLIPEKYKTDVKGYNYDGKVEFAGKIKGRSDKRSDPMVSFEFECHNVSLNPKGTPYKLTKMNGKGYFTNRKNVSHPVTYLRLDNFTAQLEGKPIKVDLELENLKNPVIRLDASVQADLHALSRFFKPEALEEISGNLQADIRFNGVANQKSSYRSSGEARLDQVNFKIAGKPVVFTGFTGQISLSGNDVKVVNLAGKAGKSDFIFTGQFDNLVAYLLLDGQKLDVSSSLRSQHIDLDELMAHSGNADASGDSLGPVKLPGNLKFVIDASIGRLTFRKFTADQLRGVIALEGKVLMTRELDFEGFGGTVRLKGAIDNRKPDSLLISYDALVNNLNINRLFHEMGNFGQTVLVDKNLKGQVSAEVQFRSAWTNRLVLNEKSVYARGDITIENGELIRFEPMLALSRFLKGADLNTIKFSTLTNSIEIKDRKIIIPMMEIKSSALDLTASGTHTFDNMVDYKLRLYLSQILGKKVRQQNTEFGTIEDDGLGRPMIFLTMKGPGSDPKFAWDRQAVEKKITEEIKRESQTFKSILKEEFGRKDPDHKQKEPVKKREELQIDYDDEE
jgi:hypothetical protein